jgi:hypothetical protein
VGPLRLQQAGILLRIASDFTSEQLLNGIASKVIWAIQRICKLTDQSRSTQLKKKVNQSGLRRFPRTW